MECFIPFCKKCRPTGQNSHSSPVTSELRNFPSAHAVQFSAPSAGWKNPRGHDLQIPCVVLSLNLPSSQSKHSRDCSSGWYLPSWHNTHEDCPSRTPYVPARQSTHLACPSVLAKVATAQISHANDASQRKNKCEASIPRWRSASVNTCSN